MLRKEHGRETFRPFWKDHREVSLPTTSPLSALTKQTGTFGRIGRRTGWRGGWGRGKENVGGGADRSGGVFNYIIEKGLKASVDPSVVWGEGENLGKG